MLAGAAVVVTMPQVKRGVRGVGQHVPGVYGALADFAAVRLADDERRRVRMLAKDGYFFRRSAFARGLAECVRAGRPVVLLRMLVELALEGMEKRDLERDGSAPRPRLPFHHSVKVVRVSPDDRIVPVERGARRG